MTTSGSIVVTAAEHGVAVGDVEGVVVGADDVERRPFALPRRARVELLDDLAADLAGRAGDEDAHAQTLRPLVAPDALDHRRAIEQRPPPRLVVDVPGDRFGEALREIDGRRPAELGSQLRGVEQVTAVVAGTVGHDRLQRARAGRSPSRTASATSVMLASRPEPTW